MKTYLAATLSILFTIACKGEATPAQIAVEKMTASGGVISVTGDGGQTWREVARGSDPALSPSGRFLAYTHYLNKGTSHERYVRIVNLETGSQTKPQNWHDSVQQYGAVWGDDGTIYFSIYIFAEESDAWTWTTGRLSYPDLHFERIRYGLPEPTLRKARIRGGDRLSTEIVQGDPPLDHDMPSAVFIEDSMTKKKVRVTPRNLWIPSAAHWVNDEEIIFPGLWHEDYRKKNSRTWIYRINVRIKDWSTASKAEFEKARISEGFQVSVSQR